MWFPLLTLGQYLCIANITVGIMWSSLDSSSVNPGTCDPKKATSFVLLELYVSTRCGILFCR